MKKTSIFLLSLALLIPSTGAYASKERQDLKTAAKAYFKKLKSDFKKFSSDLNRAQTQPSTSQDLPKLVQEIQQNLKKVEERALESHQEITKIHQDIVTLNASLHEQRLQSKNNSESTENLIAQANELQKIAEAMKQAAQRP